MREPSVPNIYEVAKRAGSPRNGIARFEPAGRGGAEHASKGHARGGASRMCRILAAKNLRTLKSGKLLVTFPIFRIPFFSLIIQGIETSRLREGYAVLVAIPQHD